MLLLLPRHMLSLLRHRYTHRNTEFLRRRNKHSDKMVDGPVFAGVNQQIRSWSRILASLKGSRLTRQRP